MNYGAWLFPNSSETAEGQKVRPTGSKQSDHISWCGHSHNKPESQKCALVCSKQRLSRLVELLLHLDWNRLVSRLPEPSKYENMDLICSGILGSLLSSSSLSICWVVDASDPCCVLCALRPHTCWMGLSDRWLEVFVFERVGAGGSWVGPGSTRQVLGSLHCTSAAFPGSSKPSIRTPGLNLGFGSPPDLLTSEEALRVAAARTEKCKTSGIGNKKRQQKQSPGPQSSH